MKSNFFSYTTWLAVILLGLSTACDLQEVNVNPNTSSEAPLSSVLSGAQGTLAFNLGIDAGILSTTMIQQTTGANGDATANDNYTATANRFNGFWTNFYGNGLKNLSIVIEKGKATNSPYYIGIARVLTAFSYGTLTDAFGDIPFTESLLGRNNTAPAYDSQQKVYEGIQAILDSAITDLTQPVGSFTTAPPASDDLIFGGNASKWLAAAWTLKARYALHLSRLDATTAATNALGYLYDSNGTYRGIASNAGDAQVNFGASATNANPFYQQNTTRPGWVGLGASFINLLNGNEVTDPNTQTPAGTVDPRRSYFATPFPAGSGNYQGGVAGVPGAYSLIGSFFGSATSPVVFISYAEAKFIEAEARLVLNATDPKAQEALNEAVLASFNKVVTNPADPNATVEKRAAYLTAKASLTGDVAADLRTIITQKYIALFLQPEAWVDYRRTSYPQLPLAANATHSLNPNGQIPRRFPYPQNEQSLNKNLPGSSNYQEPRLWWDKP